MTDKPKTCTECGGDGCVREESDRPIRRSWSYDHGTETYGAVECPRCHGSGYEPEPEEEEQE